jgi:superfamily II DNA helicase RecQ
MTATASSSTFDGILKSLNMTDAVVFRQPNSVAENLRYRVIWRPHRFVETTKLLLDVLNHYRGMKGLIFCWKRKTCDQVGKKLQGIHFALFDYDWTSITIPIDRSRDRIRGLSYQYPKGRAY